MMAPCWAQIMFQEEKREIALEIRDCSFISPRKIKNTLPRKDGSRKICSTDVIGEVCSKVLIFFYVA